MTARVARSARREVSLAGNQPAIRSTASYRQEDHMTNKMADVFCVSPHSTETSLKVKKISVCPSDSLLVACLCENDSLHVTSFHQNQSSTQGVFVLVAHRLKRSVQQNKNEAKHSWSLAVQVLCRAAQSGGLGGLVLRRPDLMMQ